MMDVLLTFTGFHDPYFKGLVDQEEQPGPILSLLYTRTFDHIFLFDTPSTQRLTGETKDAIKKLHHGSEVHVRDLENVIERSVRLCRNDVLNADDLLITEPVTYADPLDALPEPYEGFSLDEFLGSARKQMILRALEAANGNKSQAARMLGITPQAVHKFLQSRPKT